MTLLNRVALNVPAFKQGWEEMENLRGNLRIFQNVMKFEEFGGGNWEEIIQNEVSLGGSSTIKATLVLNSCRREELALNKEKLCA